MMSPTTPARTNHYRRKILLSPLAPRKRPMMKANRVEPVNRIVQPVELGTLFYTAGDETERFQIDFEHEDSTISRANTSATRHMQEDENNHHQRHYTDTVMASVCRSPLKQWRSSARNTRYEERRSPLATRHMQEDENNRHQHHCKDTFMTSVCSSPLKAWGHEERRSPAPYRKIGGKKTPCSV